MSEGTRVRPIRALLVMGTRPEAIKMAPLFLAMKRREEFSPLVCRTAQHRALLDEPLEVFGVGSDFDLDLMRAQQGPLDVAGRALQKLGPVLQEADADVVLVQGDTTTAFCGAFAAFHEHVPVGHVEAGLRTGTLESPFPEELNRVLIGRIARFHFAPTAAARTDLVREGVEDLRVFVTGNTVVDAVQHVAQSVGEVELPAGIPPDHRCVLLTSHRREHHGQVQRGLFGAVRRALEERDDVSLIYPVHPHPRVRAAAEEVLGDHPRIHLLPPLDYRSFVAILRRADLVLTDSGGVQEEAPSLDVPVIVLRESTERREGIEAGTAILAGTDPDEVYRHTCQLLDDAELRQRMGTTQNPYGDGHSCERICDILAQHFGARR